MQNLPGAGKCCSKRMGHGAKKDDILSRLFGKIQRVHFHGIFAKTRFWEPERRSLEGKSFVFRDLVPPKRRLSLIRLRARRRPGSAPDSFPNV